MHKNAAIGDGGHAPGAVVEPKVVHIIRGAFESPQHDPRGGLHGFHDEFIAKTMCDHDFSAGDHRSGKSCAELALPHRLRLDQFFASRSLNDAIALRSQQLGPVGSRERLGGDPEKKE